MKQNDNSQLVRRIIWGGVFLCIFATLWLYFALGRLAIWLYLALRQ